MPIQIDQLTTPAASGPPEWAAALTAQIAEIARDTAAQTKAVGLLQQKVDELAELVRQRIRS